MEIKKETTRRNKAEIREYILNAIDPEPYNVEAKTDAEKLKFLRDTFHDEYLHTYRGGTQDAFISWMKGLPSVFNVDFMNDQIITLMARWYRGANWRATEPQVIERYWAVLYIEVNYLLKQHKLPAL